LSYFTGWFVESCNRSWRSLNTFKDHLKFWRKKWKFDYPHYIWASNNIEWTTQYISHINKITRIFEFLIYFYSHVASNQNNVNTCQFSYRFFYIAHSQSLEHGDFLILKGTDRSKIFKIIQYQLLKLSPLLNFFG